MLIGLIGAPNKGKSTIFSAMTLNEVEIADYPFTTISPNLGIAYATKPCPEKELGVRCNPRNSLCINGIRHIPINITDIAGLVPDAHLGKGMGTQFLNDIMGADVVIQVVDLSGQTDIHGKPVVGHDPSAEIEMVMKEMANWLSGIIEKHMDGLSKKRDGIAALIEILSGFKAEPEQVREAAEENGITTSNIYWNHESSYRFAMSFLMKNKPLVVAANKLDKADSKALDALKGKLDAYIVIGCSGAIELALRKAAKSKVIDYTSGASEFTINENASSEQRKALEYMKGYLQRNKGTGISELLNSSVFDACSNIVAYPVENENKYTDNKGNVLPDAHLLKKGSTALDLARKIHTDIADKMLYAVDARSKKRLGKDYALQDGDVIKIVSAAKSV
jgi:ribosome-binding ATPase YchF (GTP1/OBG family)